MGYFSLCNEKEKSVEGQLKSALENIQMWEDMPENDCDYLISTFVKLQIRDALEALQKGNLYRKENNGWD